MAAEERQTPRFSIIIPAYNIEKYLEEAVASAQKQSFQTYEIILVNDGSTDGTGALCRRLAAEHQEHIVYIEKENSGLSGARNAGIRKARGEYLYFLDGDDRIAEGSLELIQQKLLEYAEPDVLLTRYLEFDDKSGRTTEAAPFPKCILEHSGQLSIAEQFRSCYLTHDIKIMAWLAVVRRAYLIENELYFQEGILHEDELWTPQIFLHAKKIGYCPFPCYEYRVNRAGSITYQYKRKNIEDRLLIIGELCAAADRAQDDGIQRMYRSRAACILNGLIMLDQELVCEPEIEQRILAYAYLMKDSVQKKYLPIYLLLRLLGLKRLRRLLGKLPK